MAEHSVILAADAHVHVYPAFDAHRALAALDRGLARMAARRGRGAAPATILRAGFLTETRSCSFFDQLRAGRAVPCGLSAEAGPSPSELTLTGPGFGPLILVAGRQIVTRDRLEVLALGLTAAPEDGLDTEAAIEAVLAAGGIPVLAWAPGKWLFHRGRCVQAAIARWGRALAVGDSALRPAPWPEPALMKRARRRGLAVLPGSDPLPLPGEDRVPGLYGLTCPAEPGARSPLAILRRVIQVRPADIRPAGRRRSGPAVLRALVRLRSAR